MSKPLLYFLVTNSMHQDQRLQRICTCLSQTGYNVNLVGVKRRPDEFYTEEYNCISLNVLFKKGTLFYLEINLRYFLFLLFRKFDGIVANDLDTLLAARCLAIVRSKQLFVDLHEYFTEVPELQGKSFKKKLWTLVGRIGLTRSSKNYTVNNSLSNILTDKYGVEFETIYNYPISKDRNREKHKSDFLRLVYVGVVNQGRGIKEAIQAIVKISDVTLTIIGTGDESSKLIRFVKEEGLEHKVNFLGFIESHAIHAELQKYDIGLNILDPTSLNYYYSSANKYFDYIMAGLPTISMNFPEYISLNKDYETSLLIDSIKVDAIQRAILKLQSNKNLRDNLKQNCLPAQAKFNWKSQEDKLLEIFNTAFIL